MTVGGDSLTQRLLLLFFLLTITILHRVSSESAVCDFSIIDRSKLYNYSLASPSPNFPHGVLSEDGFYKVAVNETVLWFQLCDVMIFNHNPPTCVDCRWYTLPVQLSGGFILFARRHDCGGPSRCGMGCSALVANNIEGYHICSTIGRTSSMTINLMDKRSPHRGVIVKMSNSGAKLNCSLSVSVICDSNGVQGPWTLEKVGICDYTTQLRHPSGCAKIVSAYGKGWGWFGTVMIIILCLFGGYLLAGTVYRFFYRGIRGVDIIPNLEFWASLTHRAQSLFMSLVRRFRGPTQGYRSSYSPVNF